MTSRLRALAFAMCAVLPAVSGISTTRDEAPERTIEVTARKFEFEPKEIHVRKGEPVTLVVTSQDVTHGFFSRPLHFDEDLVPGTATRVRIEPKEAGSYTVICDHYCGSGHGGMKMTIVVE